MLSLRHLASAASVALVLVAAVHCGGQVTAAPACPATLPSTCASAGEQCENLVQNDCGQYVDVTCTCNADKWTCGAPASCKPPPPPSCPSYGVTPGSACSVKGSQCDEAPIACAGGGGGPGGGPGGPPSGGVCTCDGTSWQCPIFDCPPPVGMCPPPSAVGEYLACSTPSFETCPSANAIYDCDGNVIAYEQCNCNNGTWNCAMPGPPNCVDASPPPPPPPSDAGPPSDGGVIISDGGKP